MNTPETVTFEEWKHAPSQNLPLFRVPLLGAIVYGDLTITSAEGSTITLGNDFQVDAAGIVTTGGKLELVDDHILSGDDVVVPKGEVQANFFQTDEVGVGEAFGIMTYSKESPVGVAACLAEVVSIQITPLKIN